MVEAPRGMHSARLDDRGRLKLPVDFQHYVAAFRDKKLFVTSLDRKVGKIYPLDVWRLNEQFMAAYHDDPVAARNVAFTAAELGGESEMDSQGRILLPAELRSALGIEQQQVRLFSNKGHIELLSEPIYLERKSDASQNPREDLNKLEAAGLPS